MAFGITNLRAARSDQLTMFAEFGFATSCAQELEMLLLRNLQFSRALAKDFSSLDEVDQAAIAHSTIFMGQILQKLKPFLKDDDLAQRIFNALETRNALVHHFFRKRTAGESMCPAEVAEATNYCRAASSQFEEVSRVLRTRWESEAAVIARDPESYIPGIGARLLARDGIA